MPSMSYCMFENTTLEMNQILSKMEDAESFADLELNEYEREAFFQLMGQCAKFLGYAQEMMHGEDEGTDHVEKYKDVVRDIKFFTDIDLAA